MKSLLCLLLAAASMPVLAVPREVVKAKSAITFSVEQMGVPVKGGFSRFDAQIDLDPGNLETSSASVAVDIASVDTGSEEGDELAVDEPWLNFDAFPKARFESSSVEALGDDHYVAKGPLSLRGKSREISVPFTLRDQADGSTLVDATFSIRRSDFGIGGGEWNEDDLVADEVPVSVKLLLAPPKAQ